MANPTDTFSETSLLCITKKGGSDVDYQTIIETIDIGGGAKDFESIASIAGGRLKKFSPQEDFEITIEGYAVEVGTDTGATGKGFFDLMHTADATQPLAVNVDRVRDEYRIAIMASDNPAQTSAADATTTTDKAMRLTFKNGHFTNVAASFTDKVWKFTTTYKCPPFNKAGTANVTYESTDGTSIITALAAYT